MYFYLHNTIYLKSLQILNKYIKIKPNKKYGMHAFRHSLASNMLTKGIELSEIAQILGHKSTEVTEEYIRITPDMLRECALEVDV